MVMPGVLAGIRAQVIPRSCWSPSKPSGSKHLEGETQHRGYRAEGDISLVPVQAQTQVPVYPDALPCKLPRDLESHRRQSRRKDQSRQNRVFHVRRRVSAGKNLFALQCRNASAAQPDRGNLAPSLSPLPICCGQQFSSLHRSAHRLKTRARHNAQGIIMPKNRCCFRNSQISGGRSMRFMSDIPIIDHRTELFHRAIDKSLFCARSTPVAGNLAEICQSGAPLNSSASHHTLPASIASRSVADIGGKILRIRCNNDLR